jgi:hypothetical protein
MIVAWLIVGLLALGAIAVTAAIRARNMQYWLGGYLRRRRPPAVYGPIHVMF